MVVPYFKPMPHGGQRVYGGTPVYGTWNKQDRRFFVMDGKKGFKVARLVCEAFHGPAPTDKPYCLHKDENSRNNRPDNLEWGTQKENLNAPGFLNYCRGRTGDKNPYRKGIARQAG